MRNLLVILSFVFGALVLQGQGSISVIPGVPVNGATTTFLLVPTFPPIGAVVWDFGDQSAPLSGGTVATHVYARTGSYLVRAVYPYAGGAGLPATVQLPIQVATRLGPSAPFTLSMMRVRWEDGRTDVSVEQGFAPLVAFADLKFEGTGLLQAQWLVDGIPLGTFSEQLAFAGTVTLDSRRTLQLPTTDLGEHFVTLRILAPQVTFQTPMIRYFVRMSGGEETPRIDTVSPGALRPGDEAELWITGRRLEPGTGVSFGRDIAVVAPLRFTGPGRALVKVFVAPTALAGTREVQAFNRSGRSRGPGRLEVLPPLPGPIAGRQGSTTGGVPLASRVTGAASARGSLLQSLATFFLLPGGEDGRRTLFPPSATQP